jgi:uncharacterized damage-inducible protein DinB
MIDLLRNYVAYNLWANTRILDKLATVPGEYWTSEQKSSFPSIMATLLHMYGAEYIWHGRLQGTSATRWPADGFAGTNDDAAHLLRSASQALLDFINNADDNTLLQRNEFKSVAGQPFTLHVHEMVHHCINHSTFHRGQIITMLRNLDVTELPATDYSAYLRMKSGA